MSEIVRNNSGRANWVARQSATIVRDNRLPLLPPLAVEYSRDYFFSRLAGAAHRHSRCCILYYDWCPKLYF
ncbi:MAG: hypothetical protein ACI8W7_000665 [Gammaproteobacteria bacterium]|jgi:hypothetical protein